TGEPGSPASQHPAELGKAIDHAVARLREPAGVGGGWVLVPREPTEEMFQAADDAVRATEIKTPHGTLVREPTRVRYAAMLASAPQPPAEAQPVAWTECNRDCDCVGECKAGLERPIAEA